MRMEQAWLPILAEQEQLLRFKKFDNDDAWAVGKTAIELLRGKHSDWGKGVAVRVVVEHEIVFSVLTNTATIENEWWMNKKLNTSHKTGTSSLRAALEVEYGHRKTEPWCADDKRFALCGGCVPVCLLDGSIVGYLLISNLPHECDHQLAVEALAAVAGVTVPSIVG